MKKKISVVLSLFLLFSSTACAASNDNGCVAAPQHTIEDVYSLSFDIIGGSDVMPIGGWWGPFESTPNIVNGNQLPNYNQEIYYQLLKEAGINTITVTPDDYVNESKQDPIMRALDYAEKYDMAYFIHDSKFVAATSSKAQLERMQKYINHPACVGIHMKDEPLAPAFDTYSKQYEWFDALGFEDKYLYTNMLPIYAAKFAPEAMTFETYIETYLEKVNTAFLSTDHYPFSEENTGTDDMYMIYREMSILRRLAEKHEIPFWGFVQAGGQWADGGEEFYSEPYFPNEGEMIWNVNLLLAYGCKSIQYFTLVQPTAYIYVPDDARDFNRIGLIGAGGNKNRWYYYAQKANKQIAAIDHVLMNSRNMGVIPVGEKPSTMVQQAERLNSFRELTGVEAKNAIVGCFDYFGKTALYVVNNSSTEKQSVKLSFDNSYKYEVIQRAVSKETIGRDITLTLEKGEGVMVVCQ